MKISNIYVDMELVQEGLYAIDEYDYVDGMLLTEGYARTYSFHYPKGMGREVNDENPTVIVLCTYRHPNGNMHLAGIYVNIMKDIFSDAEKLLARAEKTNDPEEKRKILDMGNYQLSRYEQMQRGLQDILSYDVEGEDGAVKRSPRPCRTLGGARGRYDQGKNSDSSIIRTLFSKFYRTYNMANIRGGSQAMTPGSVSFTPKADLAVRRKEAAKKRREEAKRRKEEDDRREAELARELEQELEPTEPLEPEDEELEIPPEEDEEEEYSEEFHRDLDEILI